MRKDVRREILLDERVLAHDEVSVDTRKILLSHFDSYSMFPCYQTNGSCTSGIISRHQRYNIKSQWRLQVDVEARSGMLPFHADNMSHTTFPMIMAHYGP